MGAYRIVIFVIDNQQQLTPVALLFFLMVKFMQENECLQSEETC